MVMFPALNEPQRLQYLQALGVTSWLPTEPLVGSLANDVLWQEKVVQAENFVVAAPDANSPSEKLPTEAPNPQAQAAAVSEVLSVLTEKINTQHHSKSSQPLQPAKYVDVATTPAEDKGPMPSGDADVERLAPLHLGLSWFSNGVLVVNDIPVQEGAAMSSPIQRLQTAIVNALRPVLADTSVQLMPAASVEFNWPLVPGPHGDHSLTGAQSGLNYSLIKLLQDKACSQLLIMGPGAAKLLKPSMALGDNTDLQLADKVIPSVYSHSLHQLLAVPSLKADTWMHLQPLVSTPKAI